MRQVFLSYSRSDADLMRRVRDALTDEGLRVWTDETLTPGTPSWKAAIAQAIESAGAVVVLLSPEAKQSEWVANELGYADAHNVAIFPLLVRGDERDAVPLQLINAQRVDGRTRFLAAMQTLVDTVRAHLAALERGDDAPVEPVEWLNRGETYLHFWQGMLARSRGKTELLAHVQPKNDYYLAVGAGKPGVTLGCIVSMSAPASVELFINTNDKARNKAIFEALRGERAALEAAFGEALDWQRLDNKRASKVVWRAGGAALDDRARWPELQDRMIDALIRMDAVFRPVLLTNEL